MAGDNINTTKDLLFKSIEELLCKSRTLTVQVQEYLNNIQNLFYEWFTNTFPDMYYTKDEIDTIVGNITFTETDPVFIQWLADNPENGLNAYQIAVLNGFIGTQQEWLDSLKGQDGKDAYQSYLDTTTDDPPLSEVEWSASFKLVETFENIPEATTLESSDKLMINRLVGGVPTLFKVDKSLISQPNTKKHIEILIPNVQFAVADTWYSWWQYLTPLNNFNINFGTGSFPSTNGEYIYSYYTRNAGVLKRITFYSRNTPFTTNIHLYLVVKDSYNKDRGTLIKL
jgi:hypothetical protein